MMVSFLLLLFGRVPFTVVWKIFAIMLYCLAFAGVGYLFSLVSVKRSVKAGKVLNKITVTGEVLGDKIRALLGLIFYVPGKIFMFFWRPLWKLVKILLSPIGPLLQKLWDRYIDNDKTKGFFRFIADYFVSYKKGHCRMIKLVDDEEEDLCQR